MIVVRLPWRAVPQYATVILDGIGPRTVLDPRGAPSTVVLRDEHSKRVSVDTVRPNDPVTTLIPKYNDALAVLSAHFDLTVLEY